MRDKNTTDAIIENLLKLEQDLSPTEEETGDTETQTRRSWVVFMHDQFSVRPEYPCTISMLMPGGNINQEHFQLLSEAAAAKLPWTNIEKNLSMQCIRKHDIRNWSLISKEILTE
ncbi:hypothetical protein BD408DRAFT_433108 [Parasitella parasitica]|nr:hypothetical protein BD408DRAFT_433108 [Parasitella parasitica]